MVGRAAATHGPLTPSPRGGAAIIGGLAGGTKRAAASDDAAAAAASDADACRRRGVLHNLQRAVPVDCRGGERLEPEP